MDQLDKTVARQDALNAGAGIGGNGHATVVMNCAADIKPVALRWLWPGKIPAGKLSLLVGDPGLGKSVITIDLAARVSLGAPWPGNGNRADPGDVIILSAEDDPADTIVPRLIAVGANLKRIYILQGVKRKKDEQASFVLVEDLALLEAVTTERVQLIVIDPLTAYLGRDVDSNTDGSLRQVALAPLAAMAARTGAAVLGVMHPNKSQKQALYRVQGNVAFVAQARAVWGVSKDLQDESGHRRLLLPVKCNLAPDMEGLTYELVDAGGQATVSWGNPVRRDAAEALNNENPEELHGRKEAASWLRELLADGPVEAGEIRRAARDNGIAERTLWRAKKAAGIEALKTGFSKGWVWALPGAKAARYAEERQDSISCTLGTLGTLAGVVHE